MATSSRSHGRTCQRFARADPTMIDGAEEWRAVPGWEGLYEVSSEGRVRSLDHETEVNHNRAGVLEFRKYRGKLLKQEFHTSGYKRVNLSKSGRSKQCYVHIMVCSAFHGAQPPGCEVAHGDGIRANSAAQNLRWASRSENMLDARNHGTLSAGEQSGSAKLTKSQVQNIRDDIGASGIELSAQYGVSRSTISTIRHRRTWNTPGYF